MNKCLFLDRDGIINKDVGYAYKPSQICFVEGIFKLCTNARKHNYKIIVITNQSGIARGYYSERQFSQLTNWIESQFKHRKIYISATYHCPHHPAHTGICSCRKPAPGMLLKAAHDHKIDLKRSIMIGDKESDIEAAFQAGVGRRIIVNDTPSLYKIPRHATLRVRSVAELNKKTIW